MIFGSDLDGVIFDIYPQIFARLHLLTGKKIPARNVYDMEYAFKIPREKIIEAVDGVIQENEFPAILGVELIYKILKFTNENKIHFISARPEHNFKAAKIKLNKIFDKNKINYSLTLAERSNLNPDVYNPSKVNSIKKMKIDYFVEDCPFQAESIAKSTNCNVLLFDTPYNQDLAHNNIIRVYSWKNIYKILKKNI